MTAIALALLISITVMILLNRLLNLHAFFCLIAAALLFGLILGKPFLEILTSMQTGFGSLLAQIGFLVALGSCLGMVMERAGAMEIISYRLIYLFGVKRAIFALTVIGVIVGIPVFCDSGFIILSKLIPSIASQAAVQPAQLTLALSTGLYTTHTLVPPTPGPLAAAANLGVAQNLGIVILTGIIGAIPVAVVSLLLSIKIGKRLTSSLVHLDVRPPAHLPAFSAFVPLVLPIILIASSFFVPFLGKPLGTILGIVSQPVAALLIGLIFAFVLVEKSNRKDLPSWISEALKDAGVILLITGAGGAFGSVIKTAGLDSILSQTISNTSSAGVIFLLIAFLLTAILKTAQGSTTSAMIITSSLLAPLAAQAGFDNPYELSTLIMAIGAGGMCVSHANDSYFWVVSQFGGLQARDALKSYTFITLAQGLTALATAIILLLLL